MIGDLKKEYSDSGGLGMKVELDPLQIGSLRDGTLYTFGESTIEVDQVKASDGSFPFERVSK